jgi:hypothetical protein
MQTICNHLSGAFIGHSAIWHCAECEKFIVKKRYNNEWSNCDNYDAGVMVGKPGQKKPTEIESIRRKKNG